MSQESCHKHPLSNFRSSSNQKQTKPKKQPTSKTFTPLQCPSHVKVTFKIHTSGNSFNRVQEELCTLHISLHRELYPHASKTCDGFVFFYLQNYIPHRAQTTSLHQPQSTHTKPSSLGLQFLKAPHLLALAMNSFRRGPSICQNAAVCVTSVKWLMQNLKQNSSKSWTHTTKIKTRRGLFLINFDWITSLQIPHPKALTLP